ncbi:MAG: NAD(P)H-binding protein [Actinoplanes sp.]
MSRISIFGAGGRAGRAATSEAVRRGHEVTAIIRDPLRYGGEPRPARVIQGDVLAADQHIDDADAIISAVYQPGADFFVRAAQALANTGVDRLLVVGLASVLPTADGTLLMDTPGYPQAYRDLYLAHAAGVAALDRDWLVVSPAGDFDHAGSRTGRYRIAPADAGSRVSYADLAVALVDEIEEPRFHRVHIGVSSCAEDAPRG